MNPTDLSEEMRQKLAAKAKNKPDYKTRLCKNFMETAECDYGEICNYAHGKDELNTDAINAKSALEEIVKKNPAYRTSLCKSGTNCRCAIRIIDCDFLYCNNISLFQKQRHNMPICTHPRRASRQGLFKRPLRWWNALRLREFRFRSKRPRFRALLRRWPLSSVDAAAGRRSALQDQGTGD